MKKMEYSKSVASLAKNKVNMFFLNSDNDKMLSVFVEMFKSSKKSFRIYASSLCNEVTEESAYIEAISSFIERGEKLYILLNNYDKDKAATKRLFKRLAYYQQLSDLKCRIVVKMTALTMNYGDKPAHLAIGDDSSFRIETDIEKRTAICNMNNTETAIRLIDIFDKNFNNPNNSVVNLNDIFKKDEDVAI